MNVPAPRLFGHSPAALDAAMHRIVMRAAARSRIRQMVKDIRHYRASMETSVVLYSPLYGEWETATAALEADMWDEFWARNEI